MYSLSQLKKGLQDPYRAMGELGWIYHRKIRGRTGINIVEADWDNLIILDACRYDLFRELNTIDGRLSAVTSRGSDTSEFLTNNFKSSNQTYDDIVYVSANPQTRSHEIDGLFHKMISVWEDGWDEKLRTVHPDTMSKRTHEIHDEYPNKRVISHFIQPHYPFIGETGQQLEHRSIHGDGVISRPDETNKSIWENLRNERVTKDQVKGAYRENLEIALPHVKDLVGKLEGKTVVTSDHGNAFGSWGLYGHPHKCYTQELVKVPWLEINGEERKRITSGDLDDRSSIDSSVEDRLAELGYK